MDTLSRTAQAAGCLVTEVGVMGHTRLLKLLYLTDLESRRLVGRPVSGLRWKFHHHGPFDSSIYTALKELADAGVVTEAPVVHPDGKLERQVRGTGTAPDDALSEVDRRILRHIARTYGDMPLATLLDEVYQTEPMKAAVRGKLIPMEMEDNKGRDELGFSLDEVVAAQEAAERGDYVTAPEFFDALRAEAAARHAR